ncbi:hypothetical protein TW80_15245 [Loktanella sp. S4079]|nr:hypothetical protein TW80_15245 [Loktanella sp. S4079]
MYFLGCSHALASMANILFDPCLIGRFSCGLGSGDVRKLLAGADMFIGFLLAEIRNQKSKG